MSVSSPTAAAGGPDASVLERWQGLEERRLMDTSEGRPTYLLTGEKGRSIRLSASAHQLLRLRSSGVSAEAIADALNRRSERKVTAEEIEEKYRNILTQLEAIEAKKDDNPMGFWFRFPILPERLVARLAAPLGAAFRPRVAAGLGAAIVASLVALVWLPLPAHLTAAPFWIGYGFLLLSVLLHELGHASACSHFGARPSDIGVTLYLVYPALYSDVSSAWKLPRRQRVVVDLGGLYFQFATGAVYIATYAVTRWEPLAVGVLMIFTSAVFSLNPIFKFDGYWVIADGLGVTNLGRQPFRIVGHYLDRLRGRQPDPLPWPARTTLVLTVYSVLTFLVWGFFLTRIGPRVWHVLRALPAEVQSLLGGGQGSGTGTLLMSLFMAAMTIFIAFRMLRSLVLQPLLALLRKALARLTGSGGRAAGEAAAPPAGAPPIVPGKAVPGFPTHEEAAR